MIDALGGKIDRGQSLHVEAEIPEQPCLPFVLLIQCKDVIQIPQFLLEQLVLGVFLQQDLDGGFDCRKVVQLDLLVNGSELSHDLFLLVESEGGLGRYFLTLLFIHIVHVLLRQAQQAAQGSDG